MYSRVSIKSPRGSTRLLAIASRTSAALRAEASAPSAAAFWACSWRPPEEELLAARVRAPFLAAAERLRSLALRVSAAFLAAAERDVPLDLLREPEPDLAREPEEDEDDEADEDLERDDEPDDPPLEPLLD
jgi:hypothetical protein